MKIKFDRGTEAHVVRSTDGEIGEEEEVTDGVCAELKVAYRHTVFGRAAERAKMDCLNVDRGAQSIKGGLRL